MKKHFAALCALALVGLGSQVLADPIPTAEAPPPSTTETIVLIRHGEKTATELGQLDMQGLNRALALPDILIAKFGKPDYLFAPNPSAQIDARDGSSYSYVRPLATIEPTAIRLGMPVNAQIGYGDIKGLQDELAKPKYAAAVVFVAWEHLKEDEFARNVMAAYSKDAVVPKWPGKDFDSIFVLRLVHTGAATTATFTLDHEDLDGKLSPKAPSPAGE